MIENPTPDDNTVLPENEAKKVRLEQLDKELAAEDIKLAQLQAKLAALKERNAAKNNAVQPVVNEKAELITDQPVVEGKNKLEFNEAEYNFIQLDTNVKRESVQEAFGDSNGSYEGFVDHIVARGIAEVGNNGELIWTGGNTRAVFVGDILGDRVPQGTKIYGALAKLEQQAIAAGGSISWLSGNHENMFNAVLGGFDTEGGNTVEEHIEKGLFDYAGNLELCTFLPNDKK